MIDRGIYTIWMPGGSTRWNGRLVYRFGGGCGTTYGQGFDLGTSLDADLLSRGYALATNTLDTFQTICNPAVSAEAALMTRERFVEGYGVPEFTIGDGGSGGAIQQLAIAQNQPGLLDALSPAAPFPDALSIAPGVSDCGLLVAYYGTPAGERLSEEQRAAVNGHLTSGTCASWDRLFVGGVDPTDGCDPAIPPEDIYAEDNPGGVRCTLQDSNVAVFGTDPATGFARRVLTSDGVQYGWRPSRPASSTPRSSSPSTRRSAALTSTGTSSPNGRGSTTSRRHWPTRSGRSPERARCRTSRSSCAAPTRTRSATSTPGTTPSASGERLRVNGMDDPNLVLWTSAAGGADVIGALTGDVAGDDPIAILDDWLTTGERPASGGQPLPVGRRHPAHRWLGALRRGRPMPGRLSVMGDPRTAAGGPIAGDVVACTLGPLDEIDADLDLSDDQRARLAAVFPDGVCDWTQPGRGQQPPTATWPDFG